MLRFLITLVLVGFWWPALAEQGYPYMPPLIGTTLTYEGSALGKTFTVTSKILEVDGNSVEILIEGSQQTKRSAHFRNLVSKQAGDTEYSFDEVALEKLWPLAPGKSVESNVIAYRKGSKLRMHLSVEVEAVEPVSTPAGTFTAVRIRYSIASKDPALSHYRFEAVAWFEPQRSLVLKSDTVVSGKSSSQKLTMVLTRIEP